MTVILDQTNADQLVALYEQTRSTTLERCVNRAPDFQACHDVTDVNAIVSHITPHLLEIDRRGGLRTENTHEALPAPRNVLAVKFRCPACGGYGRTSWHYGNHSYADCRRCGAAVLAYRRPDDGTVEAIEL